MYEIGTVCLIVESRSHTLKGGRLGRLHAHIRR